MFKAKEQVRLRKDITNIDLNSISIATSIYSHTWQKMKIISGPYSGYSTEDWRVRDDINGGIWTFPAHFLEKIKTGHPITNVFKHEDN
jgi:hypothetical protein